MASQLRIVIIGGGPAGYEAALVAAEHGADVTVVADEGLGGNSVLWDCVPSKALVTSAESVGWIHAAHNLGMRSADGEQLVTETRADLAAVMERVFSLGRNQSADIERKVERAGVRLVQGRGRLSVTRKVEVTENGGAQHDLDADIVLLSTGSNPRTLPFSEPDGERVFTSRELSNLTKLPERLIVVGSGATGAEYAHAFARFGTDVQLVSSRDLILPSEDPDAAAVIEEVFERRGMTIHRRRRAMDMERGSDGVRVKVRGSDGDVEWIEGSHALYCIGQVPSSAGLGVEDVGVEVDDRGAIPVDGRSEEHTSELQSRGHLVGRLLLGTKK